MKLNLPNITAICLQGRKTELLGKNIIERIDRNLTYMKRTINFHDIIFISDLAPNVEGINHILIEPITYYEYNRWCVKDLTNYFTTDFVLLFQDDGWPLNPELWSDVFLDYDYVGAPSSNLQMINNVEGITGGGFTLRSKRLMDYLHTIEFYPIDHPFPGEDTLITNFHRDDIVKRGMKLCPFNIARNFVVQDPIDENHTINNTFGFHNPYIGLTTDTYIKEKLKSLDNTPQF